MRSAPLLALLALMFAGCTTMVGEPTPTALVLRYTLIDTNPDRNYRYVDAGPHCSTADVGDDEVFLDAVHMSLARPGQPFLIVLPALRGDWATTGGGGWATHLPASLDSGIEGEATVWTRIHWSGNYSTGHAVVDGMPTQLPTEWTRSNPGADWIIEARLERAPSRVHVQERASFCD